MRLEKNSAEEFSWFLNFGSSRTSVLTGTEAFASVYDRAFCLEFSCFMNSKERSGFLALAPMANAHPPDIDTLPGSWPSWVGIAVHPTSFAQSSQGSSAVLNQLYGIHDPSSDIPTLSSGKYLLYRV